MVIYLLFRNFILFMCVLRVYCIWVKFYVCIYGIIVDKFFIIISFILTYIKKLFSLNSLFVMSYIVMISYRFLINIRIICIFSVFVSILLDRFLYEKFVKRLICVEYCIIILLVGVLLNIWRLKK